MSKKKSGLLIALGAVLGGAVAAGISYYLKLKSFNDELDQDFHEYEEEDAPAEGKEEKSEDAPERTYITLGSGKDESSNDASKEEEIHKETEAEAEKAPEGSETECPAKETDSASAEAPVTEEKTSSVVVEDDTEEGKAE